jgi:hypothetical protein
MSRQRGQLSLYKNIFEEDVLVIDSLPEKPLREKKIECLIDYYYWIGRSTGKSYLNACLEVSETFFLSTFTIQDILMNHSDYLEQLKIQWKPVADITKLQKHLAKKWPRLVW